MKKIIVVIVVFFALQLNAQTGIGTTTPNASAKLDVYATDKGFLPPRITLTGYMDSSTIPSPATGLLVYNTGTNVNLAAGYYYWNGSAWATIATAGGSGSFASSFLRGSRTSSQSIAVNGSVAFSTIDNSAGADIALNTSTGQLTLAAGKTYRILAGVPNFSSGQRPAFMWYNETASAYIGSAASAYNPGDNASLGAFGGVSQVIITPNTTTVLSFRLLSSLSSSNVTIGSNGDFSTTGSYPWFEAQVISGNAPVTGQSVDYGIARYTGADGGALANGALVSFDATAAGNLAWSGNKFTLKANKTYELESSLAIYQTGGGVAGRFQIYDYTNSVSLANGLFMSQNGGGTNNPNANSPMKAIITPATDIQVGVRLLDYYGAAGPGIVGNAVGVGNNSAPNASYFIVKQIGSSAIVNPWTLSGANTYNTTGNVGIGTTSPADKLVIGASVAIHDGGNKVIGLGWSPGANTALLAGFPAEIRLDYATGKLSFGTSPSSVALGASTSIQNVMSLTAQGNVGIGTTSPGKKLHVQTADNSSVYIESTTSDNNGMVILNANTNQNWSNNWHEFMMFQNQGGNIGSISAASSGSGIAYNTTSDYRLKTDLKSYSGLDLVNKIKTYDYAWKKDSSRMYGVMAHELQAVLPYMVTGEKDAVDAQGKIIPQAVDYSKLTPILVKAVQEQNDKLELQKQEIEWLKKEIRNIKRKQKSKR